MKTKSKGEFRVVHLIIIVLIALFVSIFFATKAQAQDTDLPFAGKTKNKTVKRMKKREIRNAQKGKTFYYRTNSGKIKKRRKISFRK